MLSLDASEGEARYAGEPVDLLTPERLFERNWAYTLLQKALGELRREEAAAGREAAFIALEPFLSAAAGAEADYASAARALGQSEDAARQGVSRLRKRFRQTLRRHIADTLRDPSEAQVDDELASMRAALRA